MTYTNFQSNSKFSPRVAYIISFFFIFAIFYIYFPYECINWILCYSSKYKINKRKKKYSRILSHSSHTFNEYTNLNSNPSISLMKWGNRSKADELPFVRMGFCETFFLYLFSVVLQIRSFSTLFCGLLIYTVT